MIRAVNLQGAVRADEMNNRVRFCNGGESLPLSLSIYLSFFSVIKIKYRGKYAM